MAATDAKVRPLALGESRKCWPPSRYFQPPGRPQVSRGRFVPEYGNRGRIGRSGRHADTSTQEVGRPGGTAAAYRVRMVWLCMRALCRFRNKKSTSDELECVQVVCRRLWIADWPRRGLLMPLQSPGRREKMRFQAIAVALIIVTSSVPAFADPTTDVVLRFACDSRTSKAVVAVGSIDVIKDVINTGSLRNVIDLDGLPRKKETKLCHLGSTTISIVPLVSDEHPRDDNAYILVNGVQVERTFWNVGEYGIVTVAPDVNGPFGLIVQVCRVHNNRRTSLSEHSPCAMLERP